MKKGYWVAAVLALAFVALGRHGVSEDADAVPDLRRGPQVARRRPGHGQPSTRTSDRYDTTTRRSSRSTSSTSSGRRMPVAYRGIKPGNFKDAISIVAIGRYRDGRIEAEKLLVKCPSKYQGAEVEKSYPSAPAAPRS